MKFQRLKNVVFTTVIQTRDGRQQLEGEFSRMFDRLLKGRKLRNVGVSEHGLLLIVIEDTDLQRTFSLDAMSSGEKGLILLFLLLWKSVSDEGIVLLDEPELHLNPAVCKNLLGFIADEYAIPRQLQFLICSHSPEVLSTAFERDDCSLFHLRDSRTLTIVRSQDQSEVSELLRRLGTSQSESLMYKATVFVEGEHDSEVLEVGFEKIFRRYKLKDLGGRTQIEKEINSLQAAEGAGAAVPAQYFIFDRDEAPTNLTSSGAIRILQWERRCLENYLIDIGVLADLLQDADLVKHPVTNVGDTANAIRELALGQIRELAVKEIYNSYEYENPGLRIAEVKGKTVPETADLLFARLDDIRMQSSTLDPAVWKKDFIDKCNLRISEIESDWQATWIENCDGKKLFVDMQQHFGIKRSLLSFKKSVILQMKAVSTETWRAMESILRDFVA